jgi:hypothetical protein
MIGTGELCLAQEDGRLADNLASGDARVMHLRLRRAIELVLEGNPAWLGIAARTGFADRSHTLRWARRDDGFLLPQLVA